MENSTLRGAMMNADHLTIIDFGSDVQQKGIGLKIGDDEDYSTELVFTHPNCKRKELGEDIRQEDAGNVFMVFRFKTEKDWKNFVNIINYQNQRYNKVRNGQDG